MEYSQSALRIYLLPLSCTFVNNCKQLPWVIIWLSIINQLLYFGQPLGYYVLPQVKEQAIVSASATTQQNKVTNCELQFVRSFNYTSEVENSLSFCLISTNSTSFIHSLKPLISLLEAITISLSKAITNVQTGQSSAALRLSFPRC